MLTGKVSGRPNVGQRPSLGFEGSNRNRARRLAWRRARALRPRRPGHVVDVLERAPEALRPVFRPDHDVQADQRDVVFEQNCPAASVLATSTMLPFSTT